MEFLASIRSVEEIEEAILGGADIIDLKNPEEGSLGAAAPWDIQYIKSHYPNQVLSAAIGDFSNLPNTAALAALGAAISGAEYVKIGLLGVKYHLDALKIMQCVVKAIKSFNPEINVVGAGFADFFKIDSINPMKIPDIIKEAGADIAMIDTSIKDGHTLFSYFNESQLESFVKNCHENNIKAALAGSLSIERIPLLKDIQTDVIGFRTAICDNGNRVSGAISSEKVRKIKKIVHS